MASRPEHPHASAFPEQTSGRFARWPERNAALKALSIDPNLVKITSAQLELIMRRHRHLEGVVVGCTFTVA